VPAEPGAPHEPQRLIVNRQRDPPHSG
jgi:hypothetical protein